MADSTNPVVSSSHDNGHVQTPADDMENNHGHNDTSNAAPIQQYQRRRFIAEHASEGQNFTVRGVLVGLAVGLIICFSNMYFGLQTGWVSGMVMPASLIGFAFVKTLTRHVELKLPFTPVENVLIQTVAGSMGTMPLGCGFVGVMPALNYLMRPDEDGSGPVILGLCKLIIWALGLCFVGVVLAVPLRRQVIIREKLRFPSGTAAALMIGVLHGKETTVDGPVRSRVPGDVGDRMVGTVNGGRTSDTIEDEDDEEGYANKTAEDEGRCRARIRLLVISFTISGVFTLATYFFPIVRNLPVFGTRLAETWLWTLNPSLAYVGQGIIMGPATTMHMLLGAVVGWAVLSPLAHRKGWAPGPVDDWSTGSKGWIVWVSLAIMLADAVINLGYIAFCPLVLRGPDWVRGARQKIARRDWIGLLHLRSPQSSSKGYTPILGHEGSSTPLATSDTLHPHRRSTSQSSISHPASRTPTQPPALKDLPEPDAPPEHLVSTLTFWTTFTLSILLCIFSIRLVFGSLISYYALIAAVTMALLLSIMGVRALGETDLNPVSGISKLAQLFFALVIPQSQSNAVLINLVAGAVSEAGALQAGDLMQDLKTGHLLGAAPNAQFWGQIIGSGVGAVVSALVYRLYTSVYQVPGDLFEVPTGYVWIFTARLVTGKGLPPLAATWAAGAAVIFSVTTVVRIYGAGSRWLAYVPGGIAVAVGMYNVPSFTLARAIGGLIALYWRSSYHRGSETPLVILASGLVLGEGVVSIFNLLLASASVPHL